jgi:hypothetical protein
MAYEAPNPKSEMDDYPSMYVPSSDVIKRRQYFINKKLVKLRNAPDPLAVPNHIDIEFMGFTSFLTQIKDQSLGAYLRLFFAVDDNNNFVLVFAPCEFQKPETIYFQYLISTKSFVPLAKNTAQNWIQNNYQGKYRKKLDGTYDPDPQDSPTDTNHIDYEVDKLIEIWTEQKYQLIYNGILVQGLRIVLSSYTDTDNNQKKGIYPKRLIVQFLFVYNNGEVLYFDLLGNPRKQHMEFGLFDTGNLCPPNCPH